MRQTVKMKIELGTLYVFTLQTGERKEIRVVGGSSETGELTIEVNGVSGDYSDLQSAIGDLYTEVKAK